MGSLLWSVLCSHVPKYTCGYSVDFCVLFSVKVKQEEVLDLIDRHTCVIEKWQIFLPASETLMVLLVAFLFVYAVGGSKNHREHYEHCWL